jgi:hypothetical protein
MDCENAAHLLSCLPSNGALKGYQALVSQALVLEMCETVPFIRIDKILNSTSHPAHALHHPVGLCSGYPNVMKSEFSKQMTAGAAASCQQKWPVP